MWSDPGGGIDGAERVALDARDLHEAADRIMLHSSFCGILDLPDAAGFERDIRIALVSRHADQAIRYFEPPPPIRLIRRKLNPIRERRSLDLFPNRRLPASFPDHHDIDGLILRKDG